MPGAFWPWRNSQKPLRTFPFLAPPVPLYLQNLLLQIGTPHPKGRLLYYHGLLKRKTFPSSIKEQGSPGQRSRALLPFPLRDHFQVVIKLRRRSFRSSRKNQSNGATEISSESVWNWRPRLT